LAASSIVAKTLLVALLLISQARPVCRRRAYFEGERSERTQRYQRALIREHCGFRAFRAQDESFLIA
jgi:hypothetical protein